MTMLTAEHAQTALEFLDASDREFEQGEILQGAEKLWGAVVHAVIAVAQQRGWPHHHSHRSMKNAVSRLAKEYEDPLLESDFSTAEKFHRHFYHDSMEDWERDADRPIVRRFVERTLALQED